MQTYVNRRWDIEDSRRALPRCDVLQATCVTYFLVLMGSAATIFSPHHGASGRKTDVFSVFKRRPSSTSNVNNMFGVCLISTRQFWSVIRRTSWHVIFLPPAVRFSVLAHARKLRWKAFRGKTSFWVTLSFSNLRFFQLILLETCYCTAFSVMHQTQMNYGLWDRYYRSQPISLQKICPTLFSNLQGCKTIAGLVRWRNKE